MADERVTKAGRERRKAWIYSVINPLLEGLRIESSFLERGNWTFRRSSRDLDFIRPLEMYIAYQSRPNWDDFRSSNAQLQGSVKRREEQREKLRVACSAAFDCLVAMPEFQQKVSDTFEAFASAGENTNNLVHRNVKPYEAVAELVINSTRTLPEDYPVHRFWSTFRDDLMRFRKGAAFEEADGAGFDLKNSNDDLVAELKALRSSVAEEYDIAWAPYLDEIGVVSGR